MTKIIFSFDTEDFVNDFTSDSILRAARLLREAGAKGCFQIVGLLAEALVKWGRQDVIDELKEHHEIGFHSHTHSVHPNLVELTDIQDYGVALKNFLERETEGAEKVKAIFGRDRLMSAVPPGASLTYVAQYGYRQMNIPVYACPFAVPYDKLTSRPVSFCNMTQVRYNRCLDSFLMRATEKDMKDLLDEAAKHHSYAFYHHPNMDSSKEYWDVLNYNGKNTDPKDYIPSPRMEPEKTELFFANFKKLLELIKSDGRFEFGTYGDFADYFSGERIVDADLLQAAGRQIEEYFFPVTEPESLCLSDIFLAASDIIRGKASHVCGDVKGFLCEPLALSETVTVKAEDVARAADQIDPEGFLPEMLWVGDLALGPADWLRAALKALRGEKTITVEPGPWQIDMTQFTALRDLDLGKLWYDCACSNFRDKYLSDRLRLQTWTVRLPKRTQRTVFPDREIYR